jgi:DnaJ-class molecular chaperone
MKDYYLILNVARNASPAKIKAAYRSLAALYHPDRNNGSREATEAMAAINEAYEVLGHAPKRRAYDLQSKVRESVPKADAGGALDLVDLLKKAAAGRVPSQFVDQLTPVMERKLDEHGIKAQAVTAEDVMQALGWLKPKRKKRA